MELQDVRVNDTLTLESDPEFRGYVVGLLDLQGQDGAPQLLMVIAQPGKTGKRQGSHKPFPLADLKPAPAGRSK